MTAASIAAYRGQLEALKCLKDLGADLNHKTPKEHLGLTYFAAKKGHVHIL